MRECWEPGSHGSFVVRIPANGNRFWFYVSHTDGNCAATWAFPESSVPLPHLPSPPSFFSRPLSV